MSQLNIIPAAPGTMALYEMEGALEVGEDIIAWRIETTTATPNDFDSYAYPITVGGSASNMVGVLHPSGKVVITRDGVEFETLDEAKGHFIRRAL